jgi:hypothetical protein
MIRRVAFQKAIVAGVLGALAWETVARVSTAFGFRVFDIVHSLGMLVFGTDARFWEWWPTGMILHASVGAIWAIFYAYFFWSTFDLRPTVQGILFSILPAALAGLVMVPQLGLMRSPSAGAFSVFAVDLGIGGPLMLVLGHLIYGLVLGSLYVRPVGYRTGKRIALDG